MKCPSGYRDVISHVSIVTRIRWFSRRCGLLVRIRILGICLDNGRRNTVVGVREVEGVGGIEEGSICPTYLYRQKRLFREGRDVLQFRLIIPTTFAVICSFCD